MLKISKKDYAAFENEIHDEIKKVFLKFVDEGKITLAGRSTPPRPRGRPRKNKKASDSTPAPDAKPKTRGRKKKQAVAGRTTG
jgi:hypothetical protein